MILILHIVNRSVSRILNGTTSYLSGFNTHVRVAGTANALLSLTNALLVVTNALASVPEAPAGVPVRALGTTNALTLVPIAPSGVPIRASGTTNALLGVTNALASERFSTQNDNFNYKNYANTFKIFKTLEGHKNKYPLFMGLWRGVICPNFAPPVFDKFYDGKF